METGEVVETGGGENLVDIASDGSAFIMSSGSTYEFISASTGEVFPIEVSASGVAGNGRILEARALKGGQAVVFVSTSSNLVEGDTNGVVDVFLKNVATGQVTLLSASQAGAPGNGASSGIDVSEDGTKVLFQSSADNLVAGDTNGFQDVFVKDIATGQVTLVSRSSTGGAANGVSSDGAFSPDGTKIVFQSTGANLAPGDVNGRADVFLKDLATGGLTPLSYVVDGKDFYSVPVTGKPDFSLDGRTVTFGGFVHDLDGAGTLILDLTRQVPWTELSSVVVSEGDGSAVRRFDVSSSLSASIKVALSYDKDGDYTASITGYKSSEQSEAVYSLDLNVKIRSFSGAQNFVGTGGNEVVLLSAQADKADGGGGADYIFGGRGADVLTGGAGDDILDGGLGIDTLRGGTGDDRYFVNSADDIVVEAAGAGVDTVVSAVSLTLAANVEKLELRGDALSGTGNNLNNTITGTAADNTLLGLGGNDVLDGRGGNDRMVGGSGDDTYYVDATGDVVVEAADGGIDTIYTPFNTDLAADIENLVLTRNDYNGYYQDKGNGNRLNNIIIGNDISNKLNGLDGDDRLVGNGGNDVLDGGAGNDRLEGGAGDDTLRGGEGVDVMIGGEGKDFYYLSSAADQVVEKAGEGPDAIFVSFDYTLAAGVEIESLQAVASAATTKGLRLTGNAFDNGLGSGAGNDILDGGAGADRLSGGLGSDTYIVDNTGDTITERGNDVDTLITSVGYALTDGAQVEILRFADGRGSASLDLTGNAFGQTLTGNGGASRLFGLGGDDTYIVDDGTDLVFEAGGGGNDTVVTTASYVLGVGQEIETLKFASPGGTAARNLRGNDFANALIGNAGANLLDGGGGADTLTGLAGNDTYLVDDAGDRVIERAGEGTDTVRTSVSYGLAAGQSIERLELAAGTTALDLTGNELANTLTDNAGDNRLDGGAGDDILISSGGRDVLVGGSGSDSAVIDRSGVKVALSFVMESVNGTTTLVGDGTTTTSIGNITLKGGWGNDTFTTTSGIDTLDGWWGNDVLNGGAGADIMSGWAGDDTFIVDNAGDRVFEKIGRGTDKVLSTVSYTLQAGQEIEALQLLSSTGKAALDLTGNAWRQTLVGNSGANVLDGGLGTDTLIGGKGADTFVFSTALGLSVADRIVDFAAEDTIRLSKSVFKALAPGELKASEFKDIGKAKIDADDHILYDSRNGTLFYDADGSGKGAAVGIALLDNKAVVTAADILVV